MLVVVIWLICIQMKMLRDDDDNDTRDEDDWGGDDSGFGSHDKDGHKMLFDCSTVLNAVSHDDDDDNFRS